MLREVGLIAAEDTRHTRTLLERYQITTPCISYHEHNKLVRREEILTALATTDVALVSDAGTPGVADPGFELVVACVEAGIPVSPIPGPSAPIAALIASGLPSDRFTSLGFLPRHGAERRALLGEMAELTMTLICFEAPHRLLETLEDMHAILGDRQVAVANDLTKRFEDVRRGSLTELLSYFSTRQPRGEYTLVIAGRAAGERKRDRVRLTVPADRATQLDRAEVARRLRLLRDEGYAGSMAARIVARELDLQKGDVYQIWLSLETASDEE